MNYNKFWWDGTMAEEREKWLSALINWLNWWRIQFLSSRLLLYWVSFTVQRSTWEKTQTIYIQTDRHEKSSHTKRSTLDIVFCSRKRRDGNLILFNKIRLDYFRQGSERDFLVHEERKKMWRGIREKWERHKWNKIELQSDKVLSYIFFH